MAYREFDGRTEAEAVEKACIELGIPKKGLRYDVLSHGSTGVFGLVKVRKAKIRVKIEDEPARPPKAEPAASQDSPETAETGPALQAEPAEKPKSGRAKKSKTQKAAAKGKAEKSTPELWPEKSSAPKNTDETPAAPEKSGKSEKSRSSRSGRKKKKEAAAKSSGETAADAAEPAPSGSRGGKQSKGGSAAGQGTPQQPGKAQPEEQPAVIDPAVMEQAVAQAGEIMARLSQALMDEPRVQASHLSGPEILIKVDGSDAANLIGRKGQTLDAVQHITESILNKERKPKLRIRVDAGDYLAKREENLVKVALRLAEKVKKSGRSASFSPMPANERRIIHLALKDDPLLRTQSKGSGELRKLVIMLRKQADSKADSNADLKPDSD